MCGLIGRARQPAWPVQPSQQKRRSLPPPGGMAEMVTKVGFLLPFLYDGHAYFLCHFCMAVMPTFVAIFV
jgi:hypothetical protein